MIHPRVLPLVALCAAAALLTAGCASVHDPKATRDSLTEVTEDPETPDAAQEYDAELVPDPIVDPLPCSDYLVITVRGTGEPETGQLLSPVARIIAQARPGVSQGGQAQDPEVQKQELREVDDDGDESEANAPRLPAESIAGAQIVDLDYPADTDVKEGGTVGVRMLVDTLNVQTEACPMQTFVLLGYSQGALIVGDTLAAPGARMVGATVGELSDGASERIRAVVLYGDPRFVGSEPYNSGTFDPAVNGLLPRPAGSLDAFAERLRDYCAAADFICQSSLDLNEEGHVAYFENGMQQNGAAFAISLLDPPADEP